MINVVNVTKKYSEVVVFEKLNYIFHSGEICGIIGKNGSGKSTLMRIICGLEPFNSGQIFYDGKNLKKNRLGVSLSENELLVEELDILTYLTLISRIYSIEKHKIEKLIFWFAEYFEFSDFLMKSISECSTGTKKKISICSSLMHNPDILLLDEPFENLDLAVCNKLISYLSSFITRSKTVIITSNQINNLVEIASRIDIINDYSLKNIPDISKIQLRYF